MKSLVTKIDLLPRYETKLFNCRASKIVSYLKFANLPVELLFYNSFESTENIFKQCVGEAKPRWCYHTECMSYDDLKLLGVSVEYKRFRSFDNAVSEMIACIDRGELVSFNSKMMFLAHRNSVQDEYHYIYFSGHNLKEAKPYFTFLDDNESCLGDYKPYKLDVETFRKAFIISKKALGFFKFFPYDPQQLLAETTRRYHNWLLHFEDPCTFYDQVTSMLTAPPENMDFVSISERFIDAFTVIAGSRFIFSVYLQYRNQNPEVQQTLQEASRLSENLKNLLLKYKLTRTTNNGLLEEKLARLKQLEQQSIAILKAELTVH
ncbi:hypothetical protein DFP94_10965 [Fontibacillus phaseoli]|uniref:Butirosin biosynthesis protein H-like n=1 Tax=Fontibacillus phaseoli TaxID=1416533 RepID=A0A369B7D6_9BACL|nr:hypothetical protein [Fontibacillus phaseoli]RCX17341.1 hypothetical protein DFP94_10965 [Fontibacillus phaseoli]